MVNTSLLPRREIRAPEPTWTPFGGTLDNYRRVFEGDRFLNALATSLSVTLLTVVVALRLRVPGRGGRQPVPVPGARGFILTLLVIQMIPAEGLFISQYKMLEGLQLLNTVARPDARLRRLRAAVHGLDAARLRRRRARSSWRRPR